MFLLGSTQYSKTLDDGPINIAPSKKKKVVSIPMNMLFDIPITNLYKCMKTITGKRQSIMP
jgi:hypothetical protein